MSSFRTLLMFLPYSFRFNQTTVSYDASKEEKIDALNRKKTDIENRLREK